MKRINTLTDLKKLIGDESRTLYVRWSRGFAMDSKKGRSYDHQNGSYHNGLSAVEVNPEWAEDEEWLARRVTEYWFLKMKDSKIGCHIYAGAQVGHDSDGYESIANIEHVATVSAKVVKQLLEIKLK